MISGLQMWMRAPKPPIQMSPLPRVIAEELEECKKQLSAISATPKGEGGNRIWPQRAEVLMVSPEASIFLYIQC